jgi:murein L,D-transpeptidase YafK
MSKIAEKNNLFDDLKPEIWLQEKKREVHETFPRSSVWELEVQWTPSVYDQTRSSNHSTIPKVETQSHLIDNVKLSNLPEIELVETPPYPSIFPVKRWLFIAFALFIFSGISLLTVQILSKEKIQTTLLEPAIDKSSAIETITTQIKDKSDSIQDDKPIIPLEEDFETISMSSETILPEIHHYGVVANVDHRELFIVKRENKKWSIIKSYTMARGKADGPKEIEGDLKTPEGLYFVTEVQSGERIGALYGALIFKLNYPNEEDILAGRTGSGIWIHGVEFGSEPTFTKGCISLSNPNVNELSQYLRVGSPVQIVNSFTEKDLSKLFDPKKMERSFQHFIENYKENIQMDRDLDGIFRLSRQFVNRENSLRKNDVFRRSGIELSEKIEKAVEEWAKRWSSKDVNQYKKSYHPDFNDENGRDLADFLERKESIFQRNNKIEVRVSDINVYEKEDSLRVRLFQDYNAYTGAQVQQVQRQKTLLFKKHGDEWLIVREI